MIPPTEAAAVGRDHGDLIRRTFLKVQLSHGRQHSGAFGRGDDLEGVLQGRVLEAKVIFEVFKF